MSETTTKPKYITIGEYFKDFLENQNARVFNFSYDGSLTAGNKKRLTHVSIQIPREICNENLKELDNWILFGIAIPRTIFYKEE